MDKLDLDKLKVKSFVTSLENGERSTLKGGEKKRTGGVCYDTRGIECQEDDGSDGGASHPHVISIQPNIFCAYG